MLCSSMQFILENEMKWKINLIKAINQLINKNWMIWSKIYEHDNSEKTLSYKKAEFSIHKHSKTNIISALINKNADGKMNVSTFLKNLVFFLIIYFILWIKFLLTIMLSSSRLKMKSKLLSVITLLGGFIYSSTNMSLKRKSKLSECLQQMSSSHLPIGWYLN